ncbi:MAG: circularly permuted type 2 ATP-grasp protein [Thermoleophilia bacterium]|nr:circularly permuted type 2 ATP-grasp protein [Thermoleophilia bacterium]
MSDLAAYRGAHRDVYDELREPDGAVRPGWDAVAGPMAEYLGNGALARAEAQGARLLNDHGVTIVEQQSPTILDDPPPRGDGVPDRLAAPSPWRLDPIPAVFGAREWQALADGIAQRTRLLDAVLADVYGPRTLMAEGLLPTAAILDHAEYLRPLVGGGVPSQLLVHAVDLGRDASGAWVVMSDRTQAPSGAGYALMNRRVTARVLTDVSSATPIARLSPFFAALRQALTDAAPAAAADPRVVVLSPGPLSETAYDQALLAATLGFPLVQGSDLTVRDGRVFMRTIDSRQPVDVVWRRIDSKWADPLELRAGSRLGVAGLTDCVRRGTVSVVNTLGSGALENPALLPYLPRLCVELLGENLKLGSVATWWCGDAASLTHVLAHLDSLVIRTTSRSGGRGILGGRLTAAQRDRLARSIRHNPQRYVGQEILPLSTTPAADGGGVVARTLSVRAFCVRDGASFQVMEGGLARSGAVEDDRGDVVVTSPGRASSKDVWVVRDDAAPVVARDPVADLRLAASVSGGESAVPRVLSDMHWIGRYAERGESLARLLLAAPVVMDDAARAGDRWRSEASRRYREAITHVTGAYPGQLDPAAPFRDEVLALLRDPLRPGSIAQSLARATSSAQEVREQLSEDVWLVLSAAERALENLPAIGDPVTPSQLIEANERMLTAFLALAGVVGDNMVRDPAWHMLDAGRALERAIQAVRLIRATLAGPRVSPEQGLIDAVMTALESIVTFRRRYPARRTVTAVVELMVLDERNPRSVAFQLRRLGGDLTRMPGASQGSRAVRLAEAAQEMLAGVDPQRVAALGEDGGRDALEEWLDVLASALHDIGGAIEATYLKRPPTQRVMAADAWETDE